jgi:hypothetical protein
MIASVDPAATADGIAATSLPTVAGAVEVARAAAATITGLRPVTPAMLDPAERPLIAAIEAPEDAPAGPVPNARPTGTRAALAEPAAPPRAPPAITPLPRRPVDAGRPSPSVTTLGAGAAAAQTLPAYAPNRPEPVIVTLPAPRDRVETLGGQGRTSPDVQVLGD